MKASGRRPAWRAVAALVALVTAAGLPTLAPTPANASHGALDEAVAVELQEVIDTARAKVPIPGIAATIESTDGRRWDGVTGVGVVGKDSWPVFLDPLRHRQHHQDVRGRDHPAAGRGGRPLARGRSRAGCRNPRGTAITLRQLLSHTSGEADYFDDPSYESPSSSIDPATLGRPTRSSTSSARRASRRARTGTTPIRTSSSWGWSPRRRVASPSVRPSDVASWTPWA